MVIFSGTDYSEFSLTPVSLGVSEGIVASKGSVYVVDDEAIIRKSLVVLLSRFGYTCYPFASGADLIDALSYLEPGIVLLDVNMPELNGLHVQDHLLALRPEMPIIFMTAAASVPIAVQVIKKGAVDLLEKPFSDEQLLELVEDAQDNVEEALRAKSNIDEARARLSKLTPREIEVMRSLLRGDASKSVARDLQLSPRTVEMHRANIIRKIGVRNFTAAVGIALDAGMRPAA